MMAELLGRQRGYCRGKGGSMHIANIEIGMLGANGIVGAGPPLACGAALSAQIRGTDQVCISFFGDGASNQGTFHESLNLASIWKLPVIFIAENNLYAETTLQKHHMNVRSIAERGAAYGMHSEEVDGNDLISVYTSVHRAVKRAREGMGPSLIECLTYRLRGHSENDEGSYRTKEEFEEWEKKDPIPRFREKLVEMKVMDEDEADSIEKECIKEVEEALRFAEGCPHPKPGELYEDVYVSYP
jgi:TPP-dependent pyruvate/acetoin dehydrogenase alpha subunit